ncbi:MAG: type II toxin-antitoxin system HicA family toxin [bacterium]|nr:type II toxin-antitoxin system HicA family toxin [bacterium]
MPKIFSGKQIIKILCREFGFYFFSQKGSHAKLKKREGNREIITIIPIHKELARGTLKGILELAEVDEQEFWEKIKSKKS